MAVGVTPGELRELTDDELKDKLRESKEELFNLRFQMATGQMDNNRRLREVRHDIARIYTVMRERELGLSVGPDGVSETTPAAEGASK
jgi:large subunit ribosomal protein L29